MKIRFRTINAGILLTTALIAGCVQPVDSPPGSTTGKAGKGRSADPDKSDETPATPASDESPTEATETPVTSTTPGEAVPDSPADASKQEVTYEFLSWKQAQELAADQKGKVVVLDVWSTSCPPCMREFPNLVKLQEKYGKEIVCISFNIDFLGDTERPSDELIKGVMEFLTNQNATIKNFISTDTDTTFYDEAKIGGIPAVFVYDREGKLSQRFADKEFTYEKDINPLVEQLVNATGGG